MIKEPRWSRPACLGRSRSFEIVLQSASTTTTPKVSLKGDCVEIPASVESAVYLGPGLSRCRCTAEKATPGSLYDLHVCADGRLWRMPHAVAVPAAGQDYPTILHCSDLHLLKPTPAGTLEDRSGLIEALVSRIHLLYPDLVVCTGDLIQRYDAQKNALPADLIRWQIRRVRHLLGGIPVPLYVTAGNHDVAFAEVRPYWHERMGGGWKEGTDDASVDWQGAHLVLMDCFGHYDRENRLLESSFTEGQLQWLQQDLLDASESQARLVFAHYDYQQQLPPLMRELQIDALFYGHSDALYSEAFCESGVWDGHLDASEAFQLVELTAHGIQRETTTWAELTGA
jgi:3',5'-cyclic AMP phosphodiesterase CpdA